MGAVSQPDPAEVAQPRRAAGTERHPVVRDVSAGGVVYRRRADGGHDVALVGRIRPRRWALPKGTPVAAETLEETALREVEEETGLQVRIVRPLERIQYWFFWGWVRHFKTVHFYLMEMTGGNTAHHDAEYDVVEWVPIEDAVARLSYSNEMKVVQKAQEALRAAS